MKTLILITLIAIFITGLTKMILPENEFTSLWLKRFILIEAIILFGSVTVLLAIELFHL